MIHPVILCGGSGTRLWPTSRKSFPKQFGPLVGKKSLFQATAELCSAPIFAAPTIVTADEFRFIVRQQLDNQNIVPASILLEPIARNTASAILAAALTIYAQEPKAVILALPSDHVIKNPSHFRAAAQSAVANAEAGNIVTFGILPNRPETGFGYLEVGDHPDDSGIYPLKSFVEKPDAARASKMIAKGNFLWNAGIFMFSVEAIIAAFEAHAPELLTTTREAVNQASNDLGYIRLNRETWEQLPNISIDYAVMEKASNLVVRPYDGQWTDLGGWIALWEAMGPDASGNVVSESATAIDCHDTLLRSEAEGLQLVGIGLEGIVAVAMPDAVLITSKSNAQRVKEGVALLETKGIKQATSFQKEFRPWGWYESLALGPRFQVKRIVVYPGASLSLQSHVHRSEHWIVVDGTAKVTIEGDVRLLSENQSVYIPLGAVHRLENPGKLPMILIEVQTGSYLGEDDIKRFEDAYDRT